MHPQIAAIALGGVTCSPKAQALLEEIQAASPDFFALLPPVLAHTRVLEVSRRYAVRNSSLPPVTSPAR